MKIGVPVSVRVRFWVFRVSNPGPTGTKGVHPDIFQSLISRSPRARLTEGLVLRVDCRKTRTKHDFLVSHDFDDVVEFSRAGYG